MKALAIGIQPSHKSWLEKVISDIEVTYMPYDIDKLSELQDAYHFYICDQTPEKTEMEAVQVLRLSFPEAPIYYISDLIEIDKKLVLKNGFTDMFLYPLDREFFQETVTILKASFDENYKSFRAVHLVDLQEGSQLDFDTYVLLPMNKKYVMLNKAGASFSADQVEKLSKHSISSVHIKTRDLDKFYKYAAEQLKKINSGTGMSETERRERLKAAVRDLVGEIFIQSSSIAAGQQLIQDCQNIIKTYIAASEGGSWYLKLVNASKEGSSIYNHAINTSTFAALFSMALGIGDPEQMALAALLHDLGMAKLPEELISKPEKDMTPEELAEYKKHTQMSVDILKAKRIAINEKLTNIILYHHEKFTGGGYPEGLSGQKVLPEYQLVGISDVFNELISVRMGEKTRTPFDALHEIYTDCKENPTVARFDLHLVKRLLETFAPTGDKKSVA